MASTVVLLLVSIVLHYQLVHSAQIVTRATGDNNSGEKQLIFVQIVRNFLNFLKSMNIFLQKIIHILIFLNSYGDMVTEISSILIQMIHIAMNNCGLADSVL